MVFTREKKEQIQRRIGEAWNREFQRIPALGSYHAEDLTWGKVVVIDTILLREMV